MAIVKEFREFIAKGNVIDLAVGVIIGAAFGKIVASLTEDLIMPVIGLATGGLDFKNHYILLKAGKSGLEQYANIDAAKADTATIFGYGAFLTVVLQFLIVAACVFALVKVINKLKREEAAKPAPPAAPTKTEVLLTEIRDALQKDRAA
ncbi:large conductance mechanosensitive channel protein MscL [soil metagenome]